MAESKQSIGEIMQRSMILLVQPQKWDENADDWIGIGKDKQEWKERWNEYERLKKALEVLGFKAAEHRDSTITFNCEGMNWESRMLGDIYEISPINLALLEDKAEHLIAVKEQALKKLSPEEQYALGILKQP